jgi:superfamily II DNA or RNA helicase
MKLTIRRDIRIQGADPELRGYLKDLLTMENPDWIDAKAFNRWTGNIPRYIEQFDEEPCGDFVVPRGQLEHLLHDLGRVWEIEDERSAPEAEKIWPEPAVILREGDQEPAVQQLLMHEGGFLAAPAGSGKTVMGLVAAQRLGLKCLWLTHREQLKDQVLEEIEEHLGIPRELVGVIHGKKWVIGEQITIGMIPTLTRRDLSLLDREFGVVIIDEAHHVPSRTFSQVVGNFSSKYTYGLTATAYRRDKLDAVMFNSVGPIVARIDHVALFEDEHLMIPTIKRKQTGWLPPQSETMEYHDFMEAMIRAEDRNNLIVQDVVEECKLGNTFVVLVERTKHAEVLTDLLKSRGVRCEFLVGSIDVEDAEGVPRKGKRKKKKLLSREVRERVTVDFKSGILQGLVATYDLLMEGFNYKPLNRLFLATPIKWRGNVVQALGRIQRPAEGKTDAIGYDYVDGKIAMFANQADIRFFSVYKKMNMPVKGA